MQVAVRFKRVRIYLCIAITFPHAGEESDSNRLQKIRSMWGYIADDQGDDYDYFYLTGDDVFVIIENMYDYLK